MERNLFHRVEVAFPVLDPALHAAVRRDLDLYLQDTADGWLLQQDGSYVRVAPPADGSEPLSAQAAQLKLYAG